MKKLLALMLAAAMLFGIMPGVSFAALGGEDDLVKDNILSVYTTGESNTAMGKSMHMSLGGKALNFGMGVLYAEADMADGAAGKTKVLESPWLFRMGEGFGVIAVILNQDLTSDNTAGSVALWESVNLCEYRYKGFVKLSDTAVESPKVREENGKYIISYTKNGARFERETSDFVTLGDERESKDEAGVCELELTDAEAEELTKKLGEIKNVGVEKTELTVKAGEKLSIGDMPMMTANYSDGGKDTIPVKWNEEDFNKIDFDEPGIYTVRGEAVLYEPTFPMIDARPDPDIYKYNGKYYFIATNENGQTMLGIREADTIEDLKTAPEVTIASGQTLWAPELHEIGGELYLLYAAGNGWNHVECHMRKCTGDPMDPADWGEAVRVMKKDGTYLYEDGITLDMTYFEGGDKSYVMWAQRKIDYSGSNHGSSDLYIGTVDPKDPTRLTSDPHLISQPVYGWDRYSTTVDEGPFAIKHDGKVFITYSGNATDNSYVLGLLSANENDDLLDVNNWKRSNYPVLASEHVPGELGPGHNSFVVNEYGKEILVYHARPNGGTRSAGVRNVYWAVDGTPVLYMTPERYLKSEYRNATATITVKKDGMTDDELRFLTALRSVEIPNADNIKEHIALPSAGLYGSEISWESKTPDVVTSDGLVTRTASDKEAVLTATVTLNGRSGKKDIPLTVKAKKELGEMKGYIYAYFRGSVNGEEEVQAIHLAISDDGLNWRDLNGNFPVISSDMGTKGLRDPYIIRSYEGDKFYLMATDLDSNGGKWAEYGSNGSKYLMFWESDDLINWSEQRMVKISDDNMGCTWAPEAIYDEENHEYVIYWASSVLDNQGKKSVFCSRTRDFRTFTEPEVFVDGSGEYTVIDTTMIKGTDGKYYRFTKREDNISVFMERADKISGPYEKVKSNIEGITGVEGAAIFKFNDSDKFCLMLDGYTGANAGVGFFPLVTDDISSGQFERLSKGYTMPTGAKHGVMVSVTQEEYDNIMEKWGPKKPSDDVYSYTFENDGTDSEGTLHGNAKAENGVLNLDGTRGTYFSLPKGALDKRDTFTLSMDVLSNTTDTYFFTFGVGNDTSDYLFLRTGNNSLRAAVTISGYQYEEGFDADVPNVNGAWHNYALKAEPDKISVYLDGELLDSVKVTKTPFHLGDNLDITLGKSVFDGDAYFNGSFDNVKLYTRALSDDEIKGLVKPTEKPKKTLNIDVSKKKAEISPDMFGIFFEDINYGADGGLYAESVENRSFEAAHCNPDRGEAYTKIPSSGWTWENADVDFRSENPLNQNNTTYAHVTARENASLTNECFTGFAVKEGESFNASLFARGDYSGNIKISIVDGENVLGSAYLGGVEKEFNKLEGVITAKAASKNARVRVSFDPGEVDVDMISVMTRDTFNGRENGLRKDLAESLQALHPGFMRFPGGCIVEGYSLDNRYRWKESVGPVEMRKENWNRWQTGTNAYDYCQTLGLGFYEYFLLCEDIGAKAIPVLSCGIGCQYQAGDYSSWDDLYNIYIPDALDLIEFANGTPDENWAEMTPDITDTSKFNDNWANLRSLMGHPDSFELEYLGVGNEQWYTDANRFFERYEAFEEEIHKVYPEMKLISTSGPSADGVNFDNAWNWLKTHNGDEDFTYAVDEHYYRTPEWFLSNINRYDTYDREGFGVFAGEYAANGAYGNTLWAALSEAAYLTGLEKNSDIVKLASYAPLFAKTGYNQWAPDMIWFNNDSVYGTPDYHVQSMFANNMGSYNVENVVVNEKNYSVGAGTWNTAAEFKDITVDGEAVSADNTYLGSWKTENGVISQTDDNAMGALCMGAVGGKTEYVLELKARKTSGGEGFLIPFNYVDENNYWFWNLGGWGNTNHAIQKVSDAVKTNATALVPGSINTGEWYNIKIEVKDGYARCYLNDEFIQEVYVEKTEGPIYSSASYDEESGDIIIKLVNTSESKTDVDINLTGASNIMERADEYVLKGMSMSAVNTHDKPENVSEKRGYFDGAGESFTYTVDALSFTVLRLHTREFVVEVKESQGLTDTVTVTLSDGTTEERKVSWREPKAGAFAAEGVYSVEGDIEGTNVLAKAVVDTRKCYAEFKNETTAFFKSENEAKAIVALYNWDGELLSTETQCFTGETEIEFKKPAGGSVKLMIWNEKNEPMTNAVKK